MNLKACLACGGTNLIRDAFLIDYGPGGEQQSKVGKDSNPGALLFKGRARSELKAVVCASCGFVHQFAVSPRELKAAGGSMGTSHISPSEGNPIKIRSKE